MRLGYEEFWETGKQKGKGSRMEYFEDWNIVGNGKLLRMEYFGKWEILRNGNILGNQKF